MISFRLSRIDRITVDIAALDRRIDELMEREDLVVARDLLVEIPGMGRHGAEEVLAEIGVDMGVFPTPQALASWSGVAPGSHESAGRRHRVLGQGREPSCEAESGDRGEVGVTDKAPFLDARFKRIFARRYNNALVAVEHSMITAIWHMLSTG